MNLRKTPKLFDVTYMSEQCVLCGCVPYNICLNGVFCVGVFHIYMSEQCVLCGCVPYIYIYI